MLHDPRRISLSANKSACHVDLTGVAPKMSVGVLLMWSAPTPELSNVGTLSKPLTSELASIRATVPAASAVLDRIGTSKRGPASNLKLVACATAATITGDRPPPADARAAANFERSPCIAAIPPPAVGVSGATL